METLELGMTSLSRFNLLLRHFPRPKSWQERKMVPDCHKFRSKVLSYSGCLDVCASLHLSHQANFISSKDSFHSPSPKRERPLHSWQLAFFIALITIWHYVIHSISYFNLTLNICCSEHSKLKIPVLQCLYSRREWKLFHKQVYKIVSSSCHRKMKQGCRRGNSFILLNCDTGM